jgi:hypothetical protein
MDGRLLWPQLRWMLLGEGFVGSTFADLRAHARPIAQGELDRLENLEGTLPA